MASIPAPSWESSTLDELLLGLTQGTLHLYNAPAKYKRNDKIVKTAVIRDGLSLRFASDRLRGNKVIALAAIAQNSAASSLVSIALYDDKDVVFAMITGLGGYAFMRHASESIKDDGTFMLEAIKHTPAALQFASERLKNSVDFIGAAIKNNGLLIRFASSVPKNDDNLVLSVVRHEGRALEFASARLKDDPALVIVAVRNKGRALEFASARLKGNMSLVTIAIQNDGRALEFASAEFKDDPTLVAAAVQNDGRALEFASARLKGDIIIVTIAVQDHGLSLEFASAELKDNTDLVTLAVGNLGRSIKFASARLRDDENLAILSIEKHDICCGMRYVSQRLRNSKPVIMRYVELVPYLDHRLPTISPEYYLDIDFMWALVRWENDTIEFASPELEGYSELLYFAINRDLNTLVYIPMSSALCSMLMMTLAISKIELCEDYDLIINIYGTTQITHHLTWLKTACKAMFIKLMLRSGCGRVCKDIQHNILEYAGLPPANLQKLCTTCARVKKALMVGSMPRFEL